MVVTLWLSKKARSVTETELNLSRQDEGYERFGSSFIARMLVRRSVASSTFFSNIIPEKVSNSIRKRFDQTEYKKQMSDLGINLVGGTPEHLTAYIANERKVWTPIIQKLNLKLD